MPPVADGSGLNEGAAPGLTTERISTALRLFGDSILFADGSNPKSRSETTAMSSLPDVPPAGPWRVLSLESRKADEMRSLIERHGGIATVAPSMREIPLDENRAALAFGEQLFAGQIDVVVFLTGVGAAYPLVRTHSLLNNLQSKIGRTPLILFFPGRFNGQTLQLFGELQETPYYRAFRLVD